MIWHSSHATFGKQLDHGNYDRERDRLIPAQYAEGAFCIAMPGAGIQPTATCEILNDAGEVVRTMVLPADRKGGIPMDKAQVQAATGLKPTRKVKLPKMMRPEAPAVAAAEPASEPEPVEVAETPADAPACAGEPCGAPAEPIALPEPMLASTFPYQVTEGYAETAIETGFATIVDAVARCTSIKLAGGHPRLSCVAFRATPIIQNPHADKPRLEWTLAIDGSPNGFKMPAHYIGEECGVRHLSHRNGYRASGLAFRRFVKAWGERYDVAQDAPETPVAHVEAVEAVPCHVDPEIAPAAIVADETGHADLADRVAALEARLAALETDSDASDIHNDASVQPEAVSPYTKPERSPAHLRAIRAYLALRRERAAHIHTAGIVDAARAAAAASRSAELEAEQQAWDIGTERDRLKHQVTALEGQVLQLRVDLNHARNDADNWKVTARQVGDMAEKRIAALEAKRTRIIMRDNLTSGGSTVVPFPQQQRRA